MPHPTADEIKKIFKSGYQHTDNRDFSKSELALAFRNKGLPLEALVFDTTPTGLHYSLNHFDIPVIKKNNWRLTIKGEVENEIQLSLDELKRFDTKTLTVVMECAGNGRGYMRPRPSSLPWLDTAVGAATWTGTSLANVIEKMGVKRSARELVFSGTDLGVQGSEIQPYERSLSLDESMNPDLLLAWAMNGRDLEPQHGYPLRLIVPGWYGMTSVKWLNGINVITRPYTGYQMNVYRVKSTSEEQGQAITRIRPRALMVPPGYTDFQSRKRILSADTIKLQGRAWSGFGYIANVKVSDNNGETWREAVLSPKVEQHGWRHWHLDWQASKGHHILRVCATDTMGNTQPTEPEWNFNGMVNNMSQSVEVYVV